MAPRKRGGVGLGLGMEGGVLGGGGKGGKGERDEEG